MKRLNLVGEKFGRLKVIADAGNNKLSRSQWLCKCICGNEVIIRGNSLRNGLTKSCGCLRQELLSSAAEKKTGEKNPNYKHGKSKTRLYECWIDMRKRCNNFNTKDYKYYGGKGIKICEEWNEYINFKGWSLSHGYADNLTINRLDSNGNYESSNCQWITQSENSRKSCLERRNKLIE